jgi:hypothetical protein
MTKKPKHGGARKGAGRKSGKKAFKTAKPNPTKVMRIPLPLVPAVEDMIERFGELNQSND